MSRRGGGCHGKNTGRKVLAHHPPFSLKMHSVLENLNTLPSLLLFQSLSLSLFPTLSLHCLLLKKTAKGRIRACGGALPTVDTAPRASPRRRRPRRRSKLSSLHGARVKASAADNAKHFFFVRPSLLAPWTLSVLMTDVLHHHMLPPYFTVALLKSFFPPP